MRQENSGRLTKKYGDVAVSILEKHVQLAVDRCLKPVVVILSNRSNKGIETSWIKLVGFWVIFPGGTVIFDQKYLPNPPMISATNRFGFPGDFHRLRPGSWAPGWIVATPWHHEFSMMVNRLKRINIAKHFRIPLGKCIRWSRMGSIGMNQSWIPHEGVNCHPQI